jgi:hypothetical protein
MRSRSSPSARELSAVLYPECGNVSIPLLMNASLYFDRIFVLTPALPEDFDPSEMERTLDELEVSPTRELLTAGTVLTPHEIVRVGRESLDFNSRVRILADAGVVTYLASDQDLRSRSLAVTAEWATKVLRSTSAEDVINKAQLSLDAAGLHCVDVFLVESELSQFVERLIEGTARSSLEDLRIAGSSMMASLIAAIVTNGQVGLLTDSTIHEDWMLASAKALGGEIDGNRAQLDVALARSVITAHVPVVQGLTAEDVLEIRHRLASEYIAFRTEIRRLSEKIRAEPWSDELVPEIESMVRAEIDPAIDELRRALERSSNLLAHLTGNLGDMLTLAVPFAGSLLAGAPVEQAGVVSLISGLMGAGLKTHLDVQTVKSANVMSYVLSLKSEVVSRGE